MYNQHIKQHPFVCGSLDYMNLSHVSIEEKRSLFPLSQKKLIVLLDRELSDGTVDGL